MPDEPLASLIGALPALRVQQSGGVFTLGVSTLGGPDRLGDDAFLVNQHDLQRSWRPGGGKVPDGRDWMHLHAHYVMGRDAFLTWDGPLLELAAEFEDRCVSVRATSPDEYLSIRETILAERVDQPPV